MTVLIIPGLHGSDADHWQSHWEALLPDAERVEQANWDVPNLEIWLDSLATHVRRRPGAVLVGHSLGAALIVQLSSRHPELEVAGALLVAPADPERRGPVPPGIRSFAPLPKLPLNFPTIVVASRTDPHMSYARARALAAVWQTTFVDAGDAGHINVASGHGTWPGGLRWLDQLQQPHRTTRRSVLQSLQQVETTAQ